MRRFFSLWFAIVLVCAAPGCGEAPSEGAPDGGAGDRSSATSSAGSSSGTATSSGLGGDVGSGGSTATGGSASTGGAAPQLDFFVDPLVGADTNAGTDEKPFRTLGHALSVATSGETVHLYPGTYDAKSGDTFPHEVPDGVNIEAVVADDAVLLGQGGPGLLFAGSSALRYVRLQGFTRAVQVKGGELSIRAAEMRNNITALSLSGGAKVTCEGCVIADGGSPFSLQDTSQLTMAGGELHDLGPGCGMAGLGTTWDASSATLDGVTAYDVGGMLDMRGTSSVTIKSSVINGSPNSTVGCTGGGTIDMSDASSLRIENTTLHAADARAVLVRDAGAKAVIIDAYITAMVDGVDVVGDAEVTIEGTQLLGMSASGPSAGIAVNSPGAKVTLTNTEIDAFETGIQMWAGTVKPRTTTIGQTTTGVSFFGGNLDLGTLSDPGGNAFQTTTALSVIPGGNASATIPAVGNTWIPNIQGADANGRYLFGVVSGPFGLSDPTPRNFAIAAGSKVVH